MKVYELMAALEDADAGAEVKFFCTDTPGHLITDPTDVNTQAGEITVAFGVGYVWEKGVIELIRETSKRRMRTIGRELENDT